jgi:hypothetical protein
VEFGGKETVCSVHCTGCVRGLRSRRGGVRDGGGHEGSSNGVSGAWDRGTVTPGRVQGSVDGNEPLSGAFVNGQSHGDVADKGGAADANVG